MKPYYNGKDCEHLRAYHAYYPVPAAAMLWCGVPPNDVQDELNRISPHPNIRGVFTHPFISCFEVRCRIIHDAIESGALPASRENGKVTDDHIAPERRHVSREHLKAWIAKEHPADKATCTFLFDEIERKTRAEFNADSYLALQADRDAAKADAQKLRADAETTGFQIAALEKQIAALNAKLQAASAPGERAETTYLNIIGGLLALMLGKSPAGKPQSVFDNQAAIISAMLAHHEDKPGISARTLEEKFAAAKRSLTAT